MDYISCGENRTLASKCSDRLLVPEHECCKAAGRTHLAVYVAARAGESLRNRRSLFPEDIVGGL